jgi:hypothetical protein
MHTYSPTEFLSKLSVNELSDPTEVAIFGLVKVDENSSSVIHFSNSPSCETWLSIPIEIIESIDHLRFITCKEHQHPIVKIKFKHPDQSRQDLVFLLKLLSQMQNSISRAQIRSRTGNNLSRPEPEDCEIVNIGGLLYICCWEGTTYICGGFV